MVDEHIGCRIKECREKLGLTQEQLAEKMDVSVNYISTIERGESFPRYQRLVALLNALQTSADSVFCDVVKYSANYRASLLSEKLSELPIDAQKRILDHVELAIEQELSRK